VADDGEIRFSLATSDRAGFPWIQRANALVRPFIERRAAKLWVEDCAYAERTYALRERRRLPQAPRALGRASSPQAPIGRPAMNPRGGIE